MPLFLTEKAGWGKVYTFSRFSTHLAGTVTTVTVHSTLAWSCSLKGGGSRRLTEGGTLRLRRIVLRLCRAVLRLRCGVLPLSPKVTSPSRRGTTAYLRHIVSLPRRGRWQPKADGGRNATTASYRATPSVCRATFPNGKVLDVESTEFSCRNRNVNILF